MIKELRKRVDRYTNPGRPEDCWTWSASTLPNGRPRLGFRDGGRSRSVTAARVLCAAEHGLDLSDRSWVARHTCDNIACVNPRHVIPGTYQENTADMWDRGRGARGDRRPSSVLDERAVLEIRARCAAGEPQRVVGESFSISQSHVSQVARGVIWGWVESPPADAVLGA